MSNVYQVVISHALPGFLTTDERTVIADSHIEAAKAILKIPIYQKHRPCRYVVTLMTTIDGKGLLYYTGSKRMFDGYFKTVQRNSPLRKLTHDR